MLHFIVNPVSANGRGKKVWLQVEPILMEKNIEYAVYFTEGPKHSLSLVRDIVKSSSVTAVIAVGGDGTIHEVAQELIGTDIPLGFIPAGSGNDFARSLHHTTNGAHSVEMLLSSKPYRIDVARINDKYFVNGAGIGFDGAVAKMTNDSKGKIWLNRIRLGRFAYLLNAVKLLFTFRPTDVTLTVDGKSYSFSQTWLVAVSNIPFYAGGMNICPNALYDDGLLDICIVRDISRFGFLKCLAKVFKGKHVSEPGIVMMRGENIAVDSKEPLTVHTDGEGYQSTPITIAVQKQALHVYKGVTESSPPYLQL